MSSPAAAPRLTMSAGSSPAAASTAPEKSKGNPMSPPPSTAIDCFFVLCAWDRLVVL